MKRTRDKVKSFIPGVRDKSDNFILGTIKESKVKTKETEKKRDRKKDKKYIYPDSFIPRAGDKSAALYLHPELSDKQFF